MYLQGVNADGRFDCTIEEIDVSPVQIQGPKSKALMKDLCGDQVDFDNMPFYGLAEVKVGGRSCVFHNLVSLVRLDMKFIKRLYFIC